MQSTNSAYEPLLKMAVQLHSQNKLNEAKKLYEFVLTQNEKSFDALHMLGEIATREFEFEKAIEFFTKAKQVQNQFAPLYLNISNAYYELRRYSQAVEALEEAIRIDPNYADAYFNKSHALLLTGDFKNGWQFFEWRLKCDPQDIQRIFKQPLWTGREPLSGRTILLTSEQGYGDIIQFIRYVPLVVSLGAQVVLEVPASLRELFKNMEGISALVAKNDPVPATDFYCPLMSLPLAFETSIETIPPCCEISISKSKTDYWKAKLGDQFMPRVGLVWNGGFRKNQPEVWEVNKRRNLPVEYLKSLVGIDVELISLQKGEPAESEFKQLMAEGWDGPPIKNFVDELKDFSDTAALIMNLDLVVSVDTSTAHLAATLGKPVWLLNRYDTDWRWLIDREDSPWYPVMKIYRQPTWGDWGSVIQRVRNDLIKLVKDW